MHRFKVFLLQPTWFLKQIDIFDFIYASKTLATTYLWTENESRHVANSLWHRTREDRSLEKLGQKKSKKVYVQINIQYSKWLNIKDNKWQK